MAPYSDEDPNHVSTIRKRIDSHDVDISKIKTGIELTVDSLNDLFKRVEKLENPVILVPDGLAERINLNVQG